MELGLGIHGEPGVAIVDLQPVDVVVSHVLKQILSPETQYVPITKDSRVVLMINGLGATPVMMELMIAAGKAVPMLACWCGSCSEPRKLNELGRISQVVIAAAAQGAAICGDVFTSLPVDSILAAIRAVTGPKGCLLIDHKKKVKILWFFRPNELENYLIDTPLEKEIFLATGEGVGLFNINPLEAIVGNCCVICTSKDERNAQPSDEDLKMADYIFYRTFDVQTCTISEKIDDKIVGVEAKFLLNRKGQGDSVGGNVHNSDYAKSVSNSGPVSVRSPKKLRTFVEAFDSTCSKQASSQSLTVFVLRISCAKNILNRGICSSGKCLNASLEGVT
ncbi:hypothetical protein ZIOFF_047955 [Zingiber officinale]|uniref:Uncharacterized protein n=1 Tax=Zingiber officinale TaxID=94328 RepID=A0A8J5FQE8_ZINOF|nr:hypothetical protein ZIOFF_047955 [Zingiber officinale]